MDKQKVREQAIEQHERLSKLFKTNPEAFEKERKRLIEETILSAPPEQQLKLRLLQARWDRYMRKAGSQENRLAIAKSLFWEHFYETWYPAVIKFGRKILR